MAAAAMHHAAKRNDVEELTRLLDEDPGLIEAEVDTNTPLVIATEAASVDAARLLLDRGADPNRRVGEELHWTAVLVACQRGYAEMVELLLERGGDPLVGDDDWGHRALGLAAYGPERPGADHVAVIRLLFKDGRVPVDAHGSAGYTPLMLACSCGSTDRARALLVEGLADHTVIGGALRSQTAMTVAQRDKHEGCIQLLEWYEGELHKAFLLSRARAVLDATHTIIRAPEMAHAQTQVEAQRAREEAAPVWLRGRVSRGEALPVLAVGAPQAWQLDGGGGEEEERRAVCEWVVRGLSDDLNVELMEGLRYRRWVPGRAEEAELAAPENDVGMVEQDAERLKRPCMASMLLVRMGWVLDVAIVLLVYMVVVLAASCCLLWVLGAVTKY